MGVHRTRGEPNDIKTNTHPRMLPLVIVNRQQQQQGRTGPGAMNCIAVHPNGTMDTGGATQPHVFDKIRTGGGTRRGPSNSTPMGVNPIPFGPPRVRPMGCIVRAASLTKPRKPPARNTSPLCLVGRCVTVGELRPQPQPRAHEGCGGRDG